MSDCRYVKVVPEEHTMAYCLNCKANVVLKEIRNERNMLTGKYECPRCGYRSKSWGN